MKKNSKDYTVIIISEAQTSNKEFTISSKLIRNSIISLSILLLIFGYIIFDYLTISYNKEKMVKLEKQNKQKEVMIEKLTSTIDQLNKNLAKMEDYKKRIMIATGLTSPYALKEVGTGGGTLLNENSNTNIEIINSEVKTPKKETYKDILNKSKEIQSKAVDLEHTLSFVKSVVDEQKMRLASTPFIWPTRGYFSEAFGWRIHPFTGRREFHNGIDIATQVGNNVIAPADGVVLVAEYRQYYGNLIIIDHKFGYTTRYGHLASFNVKEGQRVKRGDVIGYVGNTGRSTAPHLHYEIRFLGKPINPLKMIID